MDNNLFGVTDISFASYLRSMGIIHSEITLSYNGRIKFVYANNDFNELLKLQDAFKNQNVSVNMKLYEKSKREIYDAKREFEK